MHVEEKHNVQIIVPGIADNALLGLVLLLKEGNGSVDNNYMKFSLIS